MARRRLLFSYFYLTYNNQKYGAEFTILPFSEDGDNAVFSVTSSKPWVLVSKPEWVTLSANEGGKGETTVNVSVGVNPETDIKEGDIIIRTIDGRYNAIAHVSQNANVPYILIDGVDGDKQVETDFRSVSSAFNIVAKGGWNIVCTNCECDVDEVTETAVTTTPIIITYNQNTDTASTKTLTAVLTNKTDNSIVRTITITQAPQSYIDLNRTATAKIPYNGGTTTFTVDTNIESTLTVPSNISLDKTSVSSSDTITMTAPALTTVQTSDITYTVTGNTSDYSIVDGIAQDTLQITQEAYPYLDITNLTVNSATTSGNIPFSSNYGLVITLSDPKLSNVTVNNNNVSFTISEAPAWTAQTYTLRVATTGTVGPAIRKDISITRDAKTAYLTATANTTNKNYGSTYIPISTNDDVTVEILSGGDWLTFNNVSNGKANFTVQENTGTDERVARIRITTQHNGSNGEPVVVETTLTQTGKEILYKTINLLFEQDSNGDWYVTSSSDISDTIPVTIRYNSYTTEITENTTTSTKVRQANTATGTTIEGQLGFSPDRYNAADYVYILTYNDAYVTYTAVREDITVTYNLKQDSDGIWYVQTSSSPNVSIPVNFKSGSTTSSNISSVSNTYVSTGFKNSVGNNNPNIVGGVSSYLDTAASKLYVITYNKGTVTPYSETLTNVVADSITLRYSDTDFLANGSASTSSMYCTPELFSVNYTATYSNSFDSTTRTEAGSTYGNNLINEIKYTLAATGRGGIRDTYKVYAANRGTTTGDPRNILTITGVSFTVLGRTLSGTVTPITFTQEANRVQRTYVESASTVTSAATGSPRTTYSNIGFTVNSTSSNNTFDAAGKVNGQTVDYIDLTVTETGKSTTVQTYQYNSTSAFTLSYSSGAKGTDTETDSWNADITTSTTNYSNRATFDTTSKPSWLTVTTQGTSQHRVKAENRGTTYGNTRNSGSGLTFKSTHDSTKTTNVTITQLQNHYETSTSTSTKVVTGTTVDSTTYSGVTIDLVLTEHNINADGKTPNGKSSISGTATETGAEIKHYVQTRYTDTGYTYTFDSGEISAGTKTDTTGVRIEDKLVTSPYTLDRTSSITESSDITNSFTIYSTSPRRITAPNRGTTEGSARSATYKVTALHDSSVSDSETITQQKNEIRSSGVTTTTATTAYTTTYSGVTIVLTLSENTFKADGNTLNGNTAVTATATESGAETKHYKVTQTTAYTYTSNSTTSTTSSLSDKLVTTSYTLDRTSDISKSSGNSNFSISSTSDNPRKITVPSRGTTVGSARTATYKVTASRDTSKSDSKTVTQQANEVVGEKYIDIRSGVEISATTATNCYLDVEPNSFTAKTGNLSKSVVVKSSIDTQRITGVTADRYDVYSSNASALTHNDMVVSANTVNQYYVPIQPTVTKDGAYSSSITVSNPTVSTSSYTYTITCPTSSTESVITLGNVKFSSPSGSCSDRIDLYYSGASATPKVWVKSDSNTVTFYNKTNITSDTVSTFDVIVGTSQTLSMTGSVNVPVNSNKSASLNFNRVSGETKYYIDIEWRGRSQSEDKHTTIFKWSENGSPRSRTTTAQTIQIDETVSTNTQLSDFVVEMYESGSTTTGYTLAGGTTNTELTITNNYTAQTGNVTIRFFGAKTNGGSGTNVLTFSNSSVAAGSEVSDITPSSSSVANEVSYIGCYLKFENLKYNSVEVQTNYGTAQAKSFSGTLDDSGRVNIYLPLTSDFTVGGTIKVTIYGRSN